MLFFLSVETSFIYFVMDEDKTIVPWVWGFTNSAENWNGRLAMLGFLFTLVIEFSTGKGIIHFIGLL